MKPISLMYHDVVEDGAEQLSGFPRGKILYKIQVEAFRQHLRAIARRTRPGSVMAIDGRDSWERRRGSVCLTFDDGGVSAIRAAEILDQYGWHGHFFITTGWIGRPGFLDERQISRISRAGHVIGSHSCTHPERMSHLDSRALLQEWGESMNRLAEILQKPVRTASVPNGYYSREVAQAAALMGVQVLFTSEPTAVPESVQGCTVLGRYTVHRGMSAAVTAGIAAGEVIPRCRQSALWKFKRVAKTVGGEFYLRFRDRILASR
jgi:peptidoglycan/xylan/chitin deacetylase (PgdA/CDA1 family)